VSTPEVLVHHEAGLLAKAAAAMLVTRLVDVQAAAGSASLVLTGGGIGTAVLAELAAAPARDAVDWRRLDIWWGDERFLPAGHPERNETGARQALLCHLDMDPARVRAMPGTDGPDGDDPEAAAARYAAWLSQATRPEDHGPVPSFDIVLLGIGLRRAQHDEQRLPVLLDLRALVGAMRVLDGQIVEPELRLYLPQELFVRLVQTNPDEAVGLLQNLAGLLERDLADTTAARVRHAVDDAGGVHVDAIARS